MKLKKLRLENYKIIEDSTEFDIDQITCLVGKNESGKSAILEALYKLNPVEADEATFEEIDYPRRHISDYRDRADTSKHANVITSTWELDASDIETVQSKVGFDPFKSKHVTIKKGYSNKLEWTVDLKYDEAVKRHIDGSTLNEAEKGELKGVANTSDLIKILNENPSRSEAQTKLLESLNAVYPAGSLLATVTAILKTRMPVFLLFTDYYRMPGKAALSAILERKNQGTMTLQDKVFIAFLELSKTSIEDISGIGTSEELIMELEGVSNRISREIFEFWSQNTFLKVQFRCDQARPNDPAPYNSGYVFNTRIENRRHEVTVNFDERSTGFIWFFSFLIWFSQVKSNYGDNLFILLDEPGLALHARAQADLLRYMNQRLKPNYQVVYTTHSPFMVDPDNLTSARTVEDRTYIDEHKREIIEGTKVGDKVLSQDSDTLLPLQGALGFDITQTLFVGANTLLVEGSSDLLYLQAMSSELLKRKRVGLSPRWTVSPAGGLDKVQSFVCLFSGKVKRIAVLTDLADGDKGKLERLRKSQLLQTNHILTADSYAGQEEADVEDILGRACYIDLVNRCYGLKGKGALPGKKPADAPIRCVKEVEAHMMLQADKPEFDHFAPSRFLIENLTTLVTELPDFDAALDRFEQLFKDLNSLLEPV